jgi:serine/threonine protein kinase
VIKKIVKGNYQFISRRWKTVSSDAKKFVVRMLMHDPQRRPSAAEALEDPWFFQSFDFQGFSPEVPLMVSGSFAHLLVVSL